jgi:hypothetical protein
MQNTSSFQEIIEIVEALPLEDQAALVNLIQQRLIRQRREELLQRVETAEQEYAAGQFHRGSVTDLLAEIDQ